MLAMAGGSLDLNRVRKEMALLDGLGPLARHAANDAPLEIDIRLLLDQFRRERTEKRKAALWDEDASLPDDSPAEIDRQLAQFIEKAAGRRFKDYKPIERIARPRKELPR